MSGATYGKEITEKRKRKWREKGEKMERKGSEAAALAGHAALERNVRKA
ncbi:MAG: hypothetical protein LBT40_10130 [Deltaproteobacteria bacterium]|jgi:hypothetical protein|nr:hypothetical protein [Deltaproteobacteria bacterium]